jgi:hypothetical protein
VQIAVPVFVVAVGILNRKPIGLYLVASRP